MVHFRTRVLSAGADGSTFVWSYWYMPREIAHLRDPFVTTALFHPVGANLAFQTSTPLELALSWPVARVFGLAASVNFLQLAAVFLSALGAYLLALHVCADRRAAFFAGAAFAFVPYRFVHVGAHFNLIQAEFLPFGLLALLRLYERPTRGRALALGAVLGMTVLTDLYYTVFLLLGIAVLAAVRGRETANRVMARRLLQAGLTAGLVALPLLVPMLAALGAGQLEALPRWGGADIFSADLFSWVVPSESHPIWGPAVAARRAGLTGGGEGLAYPGLVVLGLAVAGRYHGDRARRRSWVALAGVMGVLSLGPFLQVAGRSGHLFTYRGTSFALPLPYFLLHLVPVLNGVRVPGRFAIMAILGLDVLAALTLAHLARRRPRWATVTCGLALVLTLVEFLPGPLPTHPARVPGPYHRIAAASDRGAVLEIPLQWQTGSGAVGDTTAGRDDTIFMYYATVHGKPLVSGSTSRYPTSRLRQLTALPLYRQVLALEDEPGFADPPTFTAGELRRAGIGFVVYHRDRPVPRAEAYLSALGLPVLADDGTVEVLQVPR